MFDLDCTAIEKYVIVPFSIEWWQTNILCMLCIAILLFISKSLSKSQLIKMTYFIGFALCFRVVFMQLYQMQIDIWTFEKSIPIHLCGLSSILSGLVMFRNNQLAYECLFYWGLGGALQSFLTPELNLGNKDLILYLDYFISHSGIIFSALYLTLVLGMRPRQSSWFKVFLYSQLLIPVIGFVNFLINYLIVNDIISHCAIIVDGAIEGAANYMYLFQKPMADNPLLIGDWPYYIVGIEFFALINFWLLYQPVKLLKK
jgi:hypothetical integral membrane protein (TIGR02206 family)